ncbi:MAG TPA: citrate synthase [Symbiobacteriaceae bacterium]|nr:citrate synthase [Symbiobacteriaceae bacterium]
MAASPTYKAGLEDVVAGTSDICFIDGREGRLVYCGYDITDLAKHSTFEETVFLLYAKRLPTREELNRFDAQLRSHRAVPAEVLNVLKGLPKDIHPMAALRTAVSLLGNFDPAAEKTGRDAFVDTSVKLVAQIATVTTAWERIRNGQEPVAPRTDLSHAANFLYMLTGTEPDPFHAHVFDVALILHADHELNASTFSGRVTIATLTDIYSAVTAAIGALKGPLHGGANEHVMKMEQEIGEIDKAEEWIKDALAQKKKVMGFGHRVYRTKDPRAYILEEMAGELGRRAGNTKWYEMTRVIEQTVLKEKGLYPNVDLYSGAAYTVMGIATDLFTPIFAVSRISGWTAHILEQLANNRIIRPRAEYTGPEKLTYVPVEDRAAEVAG